MRLSSVVLEMKISRNSDNRAIAYFYGDKSNESSACALIHDIQKEKATRALYFSDEPEEGFGMVVRHGETISKNLVRTS